ncbi:MAG: hypothetical protein ACRCTD_00420 [Beijerinckiaceae bacterium]
MTVSRWLVGCGFTALLMQGFSAQAETAVPRVWPSAGQTAQSILPPCTCRARGQDYTVGENICLNTPAGARRATCGMVLNNTNWEVSGEACETSSLYGRLRG